MDSSLSKHVRTVCLTSALLAGCAGHPSLEHADYMRPDLPSLAIYEQQTAETRGSSLYAPSSEMALFEDVRAARVGDIINVILAENTNAKKSSDTNVSKTNETAIANPILGGAEYDEVGTLWGRGFNLGFTLDSDRSFSGQSGSNQSNQLSGSIAVTVVDELPRGNLVVQGEKWISLNQGHEFIRIRGIIRKSDISTSNTVLSTQVADARIAYGGTGTTASANQMGWLSRFFNSVMQPF
jgi:flagellar L-ring protein precursor FlgH